MRHSKIRKLPYWVSLVSFVLGMTVAWIVFSIAGLQPSLLPLISVVIGLLVAMIGPIWSEWYVKSPNLLIEISSIRRTVSENATYSFDGDQEIKSIINSRNRQRYWFMDESDAQEGNYKATPIEKIDENLNYARQRLRDFPQQIDERKRELERLQAINPQNLTRHEVARWNGPLNPEVDYDAQDHAGVLSSLIKVYEDRLASHEKEYANLQRDLPSAERKLEAAKKDLIANRSIFTVSASLVNSGKSNTAIKAPGLLRVDIGQGNYIDIKLTLKDFENRSEISASGTRIVSFDSPEISSLPSEDRSLINTYWGQSVKARLIVEDVQGRIIKSNYISFAEGLYQKSIYDRLSRAANQK